jgi:glucose dehydrogenase
MMVAAHRRGLFEIPGIGGAFCVKIHHIDAVSAEVLANPTGTAGYHLMSRNFSQVITIKARRAATITGAVSVHREQSVCRQSDVDCGAGVHSVTTGAAPPSVGVQPLSQYSDGGSSYTVPRTGGSVTRRFMR